MTKATQKTGEDNTISLQMAKLEAENRALKTRLAALESESLATLVQKAEIAFATRNHAAIHDQKLLEEDDGFSSGDIADIIDFKPHWHWVRPLQSVMDGLHKALHGSTWNGRTSKGAIALRDDLVQSAQRRMPAQKLIDSLGGDVLEALKADPDAFAVFQSISDQELLIDALQSMFDTARQAYEVVSNGADYQAPAERSAAYANREKETAEKSEAMLQLSRQLAAERDPEARAAMSARVDAAYKEARG